MLPLNPSARERRTIRIGLTVSLIALTVAYGVVPLARRWREREDVIAADLDRLARLRGLIASEDRLEGAARERAEALSAGSQRLLEGRTPALAASALQAAIQELADRSRVTVSRLDVAGAPDPGATGLPMIPATVAAVGDVYGLGELLSLLQRGSPLLEIHELTVRPNPSLRGGLLQMTVTVRGAYVGS